MSLAPLEREAVGTDAAFADAYECSNATVDSIAASAASAAFFQGGSSFTPSTQTPSMSSFTRAVCHKLTLAGGESESDGWSGSDDDDDDDDGPDDGSLHVISSAVGDYWSITKDLIKNLWSSIF